METPGPSQLTINEMFLAQIRSQSTGQESKNPEGETSKPENP